MTVFVDDMLMPATVGRIRARWSHLFTDQDDQTELHELAARIGLRRTWFQKTDCQDRAPWLCHYDVTESKRQAAIAAGAQPITMREMADQMGVRIRARKIEGSP